MNPCRLGIVSLHNEDNDEFAERTIGQSAPKQLMRKGHHKEGHKMQTPVFSEQPLPHVQPVVRTQQWQECWWVHMPARLRRVSVLFSEVRRDGIYLTRWSVTGIGLPLLAFLLGGFEGATHWTINQIPHAQNVAFTEFFPFLLFTAGVGALSSNLGLMLTIGYALGDFVIAGPRIPLPQLTSYIVIGLVAFQPTVFVRYTVSSLRPAFQWLHGFSLVVTEALIGGLVQGGFVFVWTLSTPALIQIFWNWSKLSPSPAATYYLQHDGIWIAGVAACGSLLACAPGLLGCSYNANTSATCATSGTGHRQSRSPTRPAAADEDRRWRAPDRRSHDALALRLYRVCAGRAPGLWDRCSDSPSAESAAPAVWFLERMGALSVRGADDLAPGLQQQPGVSTHPVSALLFAKARLLVQSSASH